MGRFLGLANPQTHQRFLLAPTNFPSSSSAADFLFRAPANAQWKIGKKVPRRMVLGIAASFLDQLGRMATGLFSSATASARTKSNVEQVACIPLYTAFSTFM